jgi:hypothetical protein
MLGMLGAGFGACSGRSGQDRSCIRRYFVWWSLQVLDRLTPEYDARTTVVARAS